MVVGYRRREPSLGDFVPLRELTMIALYDERTADGGLTTRLVGVAGRLEAEGLRFGGPELTRFDKDLRLAPAVDGRGRRLDAADGVLLEYALHSWSDTWNAALGIPICPADAFHVCRPDRKVQEIHL